MSGDALYLRHILDAIDRIATYVEVGRERFFAEPLRQDAVVRQLEILGEAVKRLSLQTRDRYPDVPWRRIAGMRDVLAHQYAEVDLEIVWSVSTRDVPSLSPTILDALRAHLSDT